MYSFFILGQVPGTGVVITFTMWMQLSAALLGIALWLYVRRRQSPQSAQLPTISSDEAPTFKTLTAR